MCPKTYVLSVAQTFGQVGTFQFVSFAQLLPCSNSKGGSLLKRIRNVFLKSSPGVKARKLNVRSPAFVFMRAPLPKTHVITKR